MKTTLLFNRHEGGQITTFALVAFTSTQTQDPKVLIEKFKIAVTKWINTTDDGANAWEDTFGDFNIGDFASYNNDEILKKYLAEEGLSVDIELMNEADGSYSYDTILADEYDIDSK